jgi:hypothetical protein
LTVYAKSPERAREIASLLANLGLRPVEDEDDANAGLLTLSRNPSGVRAQEASFNVSRRPWPELMAPLIAAVLSVACFYYSVSGPPRNSLLMAALGVVLAIEFAWDGSRTWGWRLAILPEGLRVRRHFRWTTIPWEEIRTVESDAAWGRGQESVDLKLASHHSERLGRFSFLFARRLRERLRRELAARQKGPTSRY